MIAIDTTVAVAAFATWHEHHLLAQDWASRGSRLISHVAFETYAVLTRLPPPNRALPRSVAEFLETSFPDSPLVLPAREQQRLLEACATSGVVGGAVYDALVAATARHARATLVSLDRRAFPVYDAIGVEVRLLG